MYTMYVCVMLAHAYKNSFVYGHDLIAYEHTIENKISNRRKIKDEAQQRNIYRKGNLIKNDLRIRTEVLNDFVFLLAYFAHIRTLTRLYLGESLPLLSSSAVVVANKGNHHAGKRDIQGVIESHTCNHFNVCVFFPAVAAARSSETPLNVSSPRILLRFICSCFINITFDFLIQLRDSV